MKKKHKQAFFFTFSSTFFVFFWLSYTKVYSNQLPSGATSLPGALLQTEERRTYSDPSKLKKKSKDAIQKKVKSKQKALKSDTKIQVNKIELQEVTLLKLHEVKSLINKYEGKKLAFSELEELASNLTNLYHQDGYITSQVYLPPQDIKDGVVFFRALEGKIKPIRLTEGKFFKSRSIFPRLDIKHGEKLDLNAIQNKLARLNENPDLHLQAILQAGQEKGDTELKLKVNDNFPVHLTPFVDNLGRRLIGKERYGLSLDHNNLLGFGDRNLFSVYWTSSSFGLANNYEIPIGKYGTKLGFNFSHGRLSLGKEFKILDIKGRSTLYSPFISQELFRNKNLIISTDLALDFKNLSTTILGEDFIRERLRLLKPGININQFDQFGKTFIRSELGWGIDIFDASGENRVLNSRSGSGPDFLRYNIFGTRVTKLPWELQHVLRFNGQYSDDLLNSAEQIQVGGAFSVRGYNEGEFIGDSGFVISNELRIPIYFIPTSWKLFMNKYGLPTTKRKASSEYILRENIQLIGFLDFGSIAINKATEQVRSSNKALGLGAGLRFRLTKFLFGRLDLGIPLIQDSIEKQDLVVHFGLQSSLF